MLCGVHSCAVIGCACFAAAALALTDWRSPVAVSSALSAVASCFSTRRFSDAASEALCFAAASSAFACGARRGDRGASSEGARHAKSSDQSINEPITDHAPKAT